MNVLNEFPRMDRAKFDWTKLLDGKIYQLKKGVDFTILPASFRSSAWNAGARYGKKVRICIKGDTVTIQAIEHNGDS